MENCIKYHGEVTLSVRTKTSKVYSKTFNNGADKLFQQFALLMSNGNHSEELTFPTHLNIAQITSSESFSVKSLQDEKNLILLDAVNVVRSYQYDQDEDKHKAVIEASVSYMNIKTQILTDAQYYAFLSDKDGDIMAYAIIDKVSLAQIQPGREARITWKMYLSN